MHPLLDPIFQSVTTLAPAGQAIVQTTVQSGERLSREEYAQAFRDYFGGDKYDVPLSGILITFGALICIMIVLYTIKKWRRRREQSQPINVFKRVAKRVGLHPADQHLLMRIARHQNLPSPLTLLLSATTLRHHAHYFAEAQPPRQRPQIMGRIAVIRRDLFGPNRNRELAKAAREV